MICLGSGYYEDAAEIARHHRDFAKISEIVEKALRDVREDARIEEWWVYEKALKDIRKIVG